jgi:hypothetical protein
VAACSEHADASADSNDGRLRELIVQDRWLSGDCLPPSLAVLKLPFTKHGPDGDSASCLDDFANSLGETFIERHVASSKLLADFESNGLVCEARRCW